jgi:hypothetical protein
MRAPTFVLPLLLAVAAPAAAQEWTEYQNIQDGFKVDFPGQPRVTESFWTTEQNYILPARVYSAEMGGGRYSMTVVNYSMSSGLVTQGRISGQRSSMRRSSTCNGTPRSRNTCGTGRISLKAIRST